MLGQTNVLLLKQPLGEIKITEPAIHRCFLKKDKSKKVDKTHQNQIYRL